MLRRFDPRTNLDDHRILYEITGHKLEQQQFDIHYEDEGQDAENCSDHREDSELDGQIVKSVYRGLGSPVDDRPFLTDSKDGTMLGNFSLQ